VAPPIVIGKEPTLEWSAFPKYIRLGAFLLFFSVGDEEEKRLVTFYLYGLLHIILRHDLESEAGSPIL
jgi:hypothetical protein